MQLDGWTLLLQAVNLAVLLALLRWLLYKPLMAVIDKRQQRIASELAEAAQARQRTEEESEALATQRAAIESEREHILNQARKGAEAERQALMDSGEAALQAQRAEARQQLDKERQQASQALLTEAGSLAVDLATRLIHSSPTPLTDDDFVDALLAHLDSTPAAERQQWLGATHPAPVTLVCASAPSETTVQRVKDQLIRLLGTEVRLQAEAQPALLHGAELHFEHGVLSHSWAAELTAARAQMQPSPT